jgi:thiol-disulfide isomerase/thioredoxin
MPPCPARRRHAALWCGAVIALLLAGCGGSATLTTTAPASNTSGAATTDSRPMAPEFQVTLFDGTVFDFADHLRLDGRPVLLNLWASWCPPCRQEMPDLDAAAQRHPEVLFLGVAVEDDAESAATTAGELGVSYPVGFDADGSVARAFPSPGLPTTFLIDRDGRIIGAVYGGLDADDIDSLLARYLAG